MELQATAFDSEARASPESQKLPCRKWYNENCLLLNTDEVRAFADACDRLCGVPFRMRVYDRDLNMERKWQSCVASYSPLLSFCTEIVVATR